MARKIVVTSGVSGVGQSTVCALIGVGLSLLNKKVVVVDLCVGKNNLSHIFDLDVEFDISDVMSSQCRLKQAIIPTESFFQLFCLPCVSMVNKRVNLQLFEEVFKSVSDNFDFVIVDCSSLIELPYYKVVYSNSETIIVTDTNKRSILSTNNVASCVCGCDGVDIKLFVNNLSFLEKKRRVDKEIADWLRLDLFDSLLHHNVKKIDYIEIMKNLFGECERFGKKILNSNLLIK